MSQFPYSSDYTNKDYDAIRARTFNLIKSVFPTWSDTQVDNFGNILVESFGFIMDVLCFTMDQWAREGRFGTAVLRKSMIDLAKLIDYVLPGATAATADVVITLENASALVGKVTSVGNVAVVLSTDEITDPVTGEIISPLPFEIDVITGSGTFVWENSISQPSYSVASTGLSDQSVFLPFTPFLENSEVVSTPTQGTFTRVDSFYDSVPTDTHYRVQVDQSNQAKIIFGNDINGVIPIGDIEFSYRTGGGSDGNVEPLALKKVVGSFVDTVGTTAYLSCSNALAATGGLPREEVSGARVNAPRSIRTINRTVAREDYEINAERVPEVGRSLMLTSNQSTGIDENAGLLFVVPATGGTPSQSILDDVLTMCTVTYPNTTTFQLSVRPPNYLTIDVYAVVWLHKNVVPSAAKAAVNTALTDYLAPMILAGSSLIGETVEIDETDVTLAAGMPNPFVDFGFNYKDVDGNLAGEIAFSDIFNIVRDVASIRKVGAGTSDFTLNGLHDDIALDNWEFPIFGELTLINGDTGTEI
jgi:hypothetical protein